MSRLIVDQQDLASWVRDQACEMDIAVAFWGEGAVDELGLASKRKTIRVLLDLSAGASNPKEIRRLRALTTSAVRSLDRLHAKVYISNSQVLIGSANASANGLGSEGAESTKWQELGVLMSNEGLVEEAKRWFEQRWKLGREITDDDLAGAEKMWAKRQRIRPSCATNVKRGILSAAIESPGDFKHRGIYVVISSKDLSPDGKKKLKKRESEEGQPQYAWEDWPRIPPMAKLISFTDYRNDGFQQESPAVYFTGEVEKFENLSLVRRSSIPEYKVEPLSKWKRALDAAKDSMDPQVWKNDVICIDLGEFAEKFGIR